MSETKKSFGEKMRSDFVTWVNETLRSLKKIIFPSPQTLTFAWRVTVFFLIAVVTMVSMYYYHLLGISIGLLLTGVAFLEFGLMKKNLRIPFFAGVAAIPVLAIFTWGTSLVLANSNHSETHAKTTAAVAKRSNVPAKVTKHISTPPVTETTMVAENQKNSHAAAEIVIPAPIAPARPPVDPPLAKAKEEEKPTSGNTFSAQTQVGDLIFGIKKCQHQLLGAISCEGVAWNSGNQPKELAFKEGGFATDDQGNHQRIYFLSGITFGENGTVVLAPDTPVKFSLRFNDLSRGNSKHMLLQLHMRWGRVYGDMDIENVPVS